MKRVPPPQVEMVSGAVLDGLAIDLPVARAELGSLLGELGPLRLADDAEDQDHGTLICEVWSVRQGRAILGAIDQWTAASTRLMAGRGGAAWKVPTAWTWLAGHAVHELSRWMTLAPYHELLIGVPNVCLHKNPTRHTMVLGMITDNAIALSIDPFVGYGYSKQFGDFAIQGLTSDAPGTLAVRMAGGGSWRVAASFSNSGEPELTDVTRLNGRWAQPLLGQFDGSFRVSHLERRVEVGRAAPTPLSGTLALSLPFVRSLNGDYAFGGIAARSQAVLFTDVATRISRPYSIAR